MVPDLRRDGGHLPPATEYLDAHGHSRRYVTGIALGVQRLMLMIEHPLVPLHLLVFAVQTAVTTLTCLVEVFSWGYSRAAEAKLCSLYMPYLILALVMLWDAFARLQTTIEAKVKRN